MGTVLRVWWVLLSGAALLAGSSGDVRAQEAGMFLPPGLESRFAELLDPLNAQLPESWEWQRAAVELTRVDITFGPSQYEESECDQAPICLRLLHPDQAAAGDLPAGPFVVQIAHLADPNHQKLASQLAQQLGDGLEAWETAPEEAATWVEATPPQTTFLELFIQWMLLAAGLGLVGVAVLERRALWHPWIPAGLAWTLGVYGVALWLVPEAPFHDNHHGYSFLSSVQSDTRPVHIVASSVLVLIKTLGEWFGGSDALFFGVNRALMALSSALLGWWVGRVTQSRGSGLLAAGMWGLSPMALRLGGTDSLFNLSLVFLLGAALLLGRSMEWIGQRRWWGVVHAVVAALLVALAGQTHVPALLLVPAALPLALARGQASTVRQWVTVGGAAALAIGLLLPNVVAILEVAAGSDGPTFIEAGNILLARSWAQRLLWNGDWVGMAVLPLALFGGAALIRKRHCVGWWVAGAWGTLLLVSLSIATCLHLHAVWETTWVALTTGLAAHGGYVAFEAVAARLKGKVAAAVMLLCAALVVGSVLQPWPILKLLPPVAQEYLFLQECVLPVMAKRVGSHILVPNSVRTEESPRMPLPLAWGEKQTPGVVWHDTAAELLEQGPKGEKYVYIGLSCVRPASEVGESEDASDKFEMRSVPVVADYCVKQLKGLVLEPIVFAKLTNEPKGLYCVGFPNVPLRIGLFRVVDLPPREAAGSTPGK